MARVILIPGTHGALGRMDNNSRWWRPGLEFWDMLKAAGHHPESFGWDTFIEGMFGPNTRWKNNGEWLARLVMAGERPCVIAFSHGGNILPYASLAGAEFGHVVTVGTPPRTDVDYAALRDHCHFWTHIHGNWRDVLAVLGGVGDGDFNWFRRRMPLADKNIQLPMGHTELIDPAVWREHGLLDSLGKVL